MPLDPDLKALLDNAPASPALETLGASEARALYESRPRPPAPDVGAVAERVIQGPGGALRLRIYTPAGGSGPYPLLVFFHGSGFVLCSLDTHDGICRQLCAGAGYVIVSVDYRLAPEAKFPAATEDCLFATRWAADHAAELNARSNCIVVGGDSAGGNLAAVTALRVRDEGGPALAGQLLIYPVVDYHTPGTPSYLDNAEGYGLSRAGMIWFWDQYLGSAADAAHPHASPLRAASLDRLPKALVYTAEFDPLRDEGEAYGARLEAAGVPVRSIRWDGMNHGFFGLAGWVTKADAATRDACDWLRTVGTQTAA
jgi:acetyl esterase